MNTAPFEAARVFLINSNVTIGMRSLDSWDNAEVAVFPVIIFKIVGVRNEDVIVVHCGRVGPQKCRSRFAWYKSSFIANFAMGCLISILIRPVLSILTKDQTGVFPYYLCYGLLTFT